YIEKDVTIGPVKVLHNYVSENKFSVRTSFSEEKFDYDNDAVISVFYDLVNNKEKWINLNSDDYPIIYLKGKVKRYSNNSQVYISADVIAESHEELINDVANINVENRKPSDSTIIKCAKTVISNQAYSPSSISWGSCKILDSDDYGRYLVELELDAQNRFGSMLRKKYLIVIYDVSADGHFRYSPSTSCLEVEDNYSLELTTATIKECNQWNKTFEGSQTNSIEQINYIAYTNDRFGFSIEYPEDFTEQTESDNGDGIILKNSTQQAELIVSGRVRTDSDSIESQYQSELNLHNSIDYKLCKDNWFVLSWIEGDTEYYRKVIVGRDLICSFEISYPTKDGDNYDKIIEHLLNSFETPYIDDYCIE
ncbi:MAG: hypothetical protein J6F30_08055, partial [Cellulosilyticum sp.]|nr:hypothetical protein [Cellulosilyticum sp.]